MQNQANIRRSILPSALVAAFAAVLGLLPSIAQAQYNAPPLSEGAIGENYHVELSGSFWIPGLSGLFSSDQFGIKGTSLDLNTDLGFVQTRFRDFGIVLRPAQKHKFRFQNTPIDYIATSTLTRTITYNGISFPATLPISSEFSWKVWRMGYEYDFAYMDRGYIGALIEARYTQFTSSIQSISPLLTASEFTTARAPLPAVGVVGRGYVARNVAINFELSGFRIPSGFRDRIVGNYFDWNIGTTVNLTNNVGVQAGFRRMTTYIDVNQNVGDFALQGMWFGAAVRF